MRILKAWSKIVIFIAGLICGMLIYALTVSEVPQQPREVYGGGAGLQIHVLLDRDYYHSLLADLRNSVKSVKVVMYSMIYDEKDHFDWANDLIRELVNAKQRGVDVRVVIEYRTYYGYMNDNLPAYDYLTSHGVYVKLDNETDTDHLKLVLIDDEIVYIGSHNWSESALYYNREASVKIISKEVANIFIDYLKRNYGI
ncbi:MAG: phospholipase D-like domain-containing protein [Candidatus Nezhaarchaeales archaeon]